MMPMTRTTALFGSALLSFAATALAQAPSPSTPRPPVAQPSAPRLSDPQIAAIAVTANTVDVNMGKLALSKTRNSQVRLFAERMIADHQAVIKQATDLVTRLKVRPETSTERENLTRDGSATMEKLRKLDGPAFDRAYVDSEVAYHKAVLNALDRTLIPSATNVELKTLLTKVRPVIQAHLQHAEQLQAQLNKR